MKVNYLSALIIGALLIGHFPTGPVNAQSPTPEEQCFTHLANAARNTPGLNIDLSKVTKINGKNNKFESDEFSVKTHADFINAFENYPIPNYQSDVVHYPNNMDEVPNDYKFMPKVHKSNRNNTASVIYEDETITPIDHWMSRTGAGTESDINDFFSGTKTAAQLNAKHDRQRINGHYIDSRYMSFGRESELDFSFPTRAANPARDGYYPVGRPVRDMREYLIYTHHLAKKFSNDKINGDLLSCELIKITPQSGYKLKDFNNTGKSISWENYGGSRISQTDISTRPIASNTFREGKLNYTITTRTDPNKNLLRFNGINISYNNGNSFYNPYTTLKLFEDSVKSAPVGTSTFLEMRRDYYNRIIASGMGIATGATGAAPGESIDQGVWCGLKLPQASTAVQLCRGREPEVGNCPGGYQITNMLNLGRGNWKTCTKVDVDYSGSTEDEGLMCGIKMSSDPGRVVRCEGLDPQVSCPAGYASKSFNPPSGYGGTWYACFKQSGQSSEALPSGTMCGLKLGQDSNPVRTCEGENIQTSCPDGYSTTQWSNISPSWGRWFSCTKDAETGSAPATPPASTPPAPTCIPGTKGC